MRLVEHTRRALQIVFLLLTALATLVLGAIFLVVWTLCLPLVLIEKLYHWTFPERGRRVR